MRAPKAPILFPSTPREIVINFGRTLWLGAYTGNLKEVLKGLR